MDLSQYNHEDYTHLLQCRHVIGGSGRSVLSYGMPCTLVRLTKSGKALVVVFGDRYWPNTRHIKRTRYVATHRLRRRKEE